MLVFNLTAKPIQYRGRSLPANGGFYDFTNMDFIPNRDLELQVKKVLAFGSLPAWWTSLQNLERPFVSLEPTTPKATFPMVEVLPMAMPDYDPEHVASMAAKIDIKTDDSANKRNRK